MLNWTVRRSVYWCCYSVYWCRCFVASINRRASVVVLILLMVYLGTCCGTSSIGEPSTPSIETSTPIIGETSTSSIDEASTPSIDETSTSSVNETSTSSIGLQCAVLLKYW